MGAEHDHGGGGHAGHNHGAGASTKRLAIALGLTTTFLVAELVGAFVFGSLALLSDAAHMFTDSAALAIALAAVKIGQRPPDDSAPLATAALKSLPLRSTPSCCSWSRVMC